MASPAVIAISPSGRWLATTESSSSTRVSIRDSNTGRLQCTIRCVDHVIKLVWITDTLLAAAAESIVLLDVTRGVALKATHGSKKLQSHTAVMDVAVMDSLLYVLERKNGKLVVYEYNQEQQLLRKIKVGKTSSSSKEEEMKLLATTGYLLVGSTSPTSSWRVVDRSTGSKICKIVGHIMAAAGSWACGCTTEGATVFTLWNLAQSGKVGGTIAAVATDAVQLFALSQRNECHLLAGNKQLFRIKAHNSGEDDSSSTVSSELVCELPDQEARKQKDVHYILHQEVRALRFTDEMECMAQVVDTSVEGGVVTLDWNKPTEQPSTTLKRKQQPVVLGPGQAGHEATNLTEATTTAPKKRSRTDNSEEEESDDNLEENAEETEDDGPTIAERLALLQKTLEQEEAKEQENAEEFKAKSESLAPTTKMTTESLYQLLHQALQSADKQQLEMALQVRDAHTVNASCQELDSESAAALLVALTHRLATQPVRADHFSVWLSAILSNPHVSVEHLMPLQNLLQERLEIFPMLLELEGRLDQLAGS